MGTSKLAKRLFPSRLPLWRAPGWHNPTLLLWCQSQSKRRESGYPVMVLLYFLPNDTKTLTILMIKWHDDGGKDYCVGGWGRSSYPCWIWSSSAPRWCRRLDVMGWISTLSVSKWKINSGLIQKAWGNTQFQARWKELNRTELNWNHPLLMADVRTDPCS